MRIRHIMVSELSARTERNGAAGDRGPIYAGMSFTTSVNFPEFIS